MLKEIGSNFWLDPHQHYENVVLGTPEQFNCSGSDFVWLSTGRSAIRFVIDSIEERNPKKKKVAILPSFTCDTVVAPFIQAGYEVHYYQVSKALATSSDHILNTAFEYGASIVLFHRYFGFDTLDCQIDIMCERLREAEISTIEDCTQCLYSMIPRGDADYYVGSIRKWAGTPDGGFAVCRAGKFTKKPLCSDVELEHAKVSASYAKYEYIIHHHGDKSRVLAMYREAEDILDNQSTVFAISDTSATVQANLDMEALVMKRRNNYKLLEESLASKVYRVFSLKEGVVPLYFPILVDDRVSLQRCLIDNAVYAPIVWPKDKCQPIQSNETEHLYQHMLCIPIDQRYDKDDMNRVIGVINCFYE